MHLPKHEKILSFSSNIPSNTLTFLVLGEERLRNMSCNGCRALRKGCGDSCVLRPSLGRIIGHQAQVNAILFVAKFFGRSALIGFLSAVPDDRKSALFQSLLFEACGRTVNPVSGAVGLLSTGKWHVCKAAVDTVLNSRTPQPPPENFLTNFIEDSGDTKPSFSLPGTQRKRQATNSTMELSISALSSSNL